jgi:preprotein translocase subunit SecG
MQKSKSDGGLGAALGGGASEAAFGADTSNVLATITRNGTIAFFIICFALYLAQISRHADKAAGEALPTIEVPAEIPAAAVPAVPATPMLDGAVEAEPVK